MLVDISSFRRKIFRYSVVFLILVVGFSGYQPKPAVAQNSGNLIVNMIVTPASALPLGGNVTYTINISNPTTNTIYKANISDTLPTGLVFGSWLSQGVANESNNTVTLISDIAPGELKIVSFTATAPSDPSFYNQVFYNTVTYSSNSGDNGASSANFAMSGPPAANVTIAYGSQIMVITDTVSISNNSANPAIGFSFVDTLPDHSTFGGWIQNNHAIQSGNQITWQGNLDGNASFTLKYSLIIDPNPALSGQTVTESLQYSTSGDAPTSVNSNILIPFRTFIPVIESPDCSSIFSCVTLP